MVALMPYIAKAGAESARQLDLTSSFPGMLLDINPFV